MRRIKLNASADDLPGGAAEIPSGDAKKKSIEAELGRFQGTWKFVSIEAEGDRASQEDLVSVTVVIQGNRFTLRNGPTINRGVLTVDPTVIPKTIDVAFSEGTQRGMISQGIYELDGDLLKVCNGSSDKGRPTEFASKSGSGLTVQLLKRAKPPVAQPKR
jgi:uncharacterized protein (TIGR03067 family)